MLQQMQTCNFPDGLRATPSEGKACGRDECFIRDIEPQVLGISNSINRPMSQGSALPRRNASLHETRKRESRSGDSENNMLTTLNDKKIRKSDPPKIARVMRTTTTKPVSSAQGPMTHKRNVKDQAPGAKERDTKKRIWSR